MGIPGGSTETDVAATTAAAASLPFSPPCACYDVNGLRTVEMKETSQLGYAAGHADCRTCGEHGLLLQRDAVTGRSTKTAAPSTN